MGAMNGKDSAVLGTALKLPLTFSPRKQFLSERNVLWRMVRSEERSASDDDDVT